MGRATLGGPPILPGPVRVCGTGGTAIQPLVDDFDGSDETEVQNERLEPGDSGSDLFEVREIREGHGDDDIPADHRRCVSSKDDQTPPQSEILKVIHRFACEPSRALQDKPDPLRVEECRLAETLRDQAGYGGLPDPKSAVDENYHLNGWRPGYGIFPASTSRMNWITPLNQVC